MVKVIAFRLTDGQKLKDEENSRCYVLSFPGQSTARLLHKLIAAEIILFTVVFLIVGWDVEEAIKVTKELMAQKKSPSAAGDPALEHVIEFCLKIHPQHPLACSSLQLASDWPTFCAKVFGVL